MSSVGKTLNAAQRADAKARERAEKLFGRLEQNGLGSFKLDYQKTVWCDLYAEIAASGELLWPKGIHRRRPMGQSCLNCAVKAAILAVETDEDGKKVYRPGPNF